MPGAKKPVAAVERGAAAALGALAAALGAATLTTGSEAVEPAAVTSPADDPALLAAAADLEPAAVGVLAGCGERLAGLGARHDTVTGARAAAEVDQVALDGDLDALVRAPRRSLDPPDGDEEAEREQEREKDEGRRTCEGKAWCGVVRHGLLSEMYWLAAGRRGPANFAVRRDECRIGLQKRINGWPAATPRNPLIRSDYPLRCYLGMDCKAA